jgi:hypothetical protein
MTRPSLIIGLGGTGQWVLTFLKKELLEISGGSLPPTVKLICFDTISRTTARTGRGRSREDQDAVRAGAVELLEGEEFIPIGDSVSRLAQEIAAGHHSHLQWFPAKTFLGKLPPAALNIREGSGQIRQMGRIAIFQDLSAFTNSQILSRFRAALLDLQNKVSRDSQLEVIIVGSLAGGTGAGMLVDMALLVRAQASRIVANNYVVRGFFVLPRAFASGGVGEGRDMLARSFAAWRELDRFMIVSDRFGLRQMNYHEQNKDLRLPIDKRAYDVSYMVDPAREVNSLENIKPEKGIFPALAHCISAILDDKAGKAYTEFVSSNLAGKLASLPRRPYHSAIGSYTLKVPVYYAQEKFSHQLALEVLREFLAPEVNDKGRVIRVSELRNREALEGEGGRTAVLKFLNASGLNIDGEEIPNTRLTPLIGKIREKEARQDNTIILQWAGGGLTKIDSHILSALTHISQDEEGKLIARNISGELDKPIWEYVAPPRAAKQTPEEAFTRIKNRVPEVRTEHYGLDTAGGERLRGLYGRALAQAKRAQLVRFQKLLQAWTRRTLNGQSVDPHTARGGKIGYVRAFYAELADTLAYFIGFLNKVRLVRNEDLKLASRTSEASRRSLMQYQKEMGKKCWVTFWEDFTHPDAHRAARNYLLAEQRDIDVRKDDLLLDVLAETAAEMQALTEKTRDEIDLWIAHLVTGDSGRSITSLYSAAIDSLANVSINHQSDIGQEKVSKLIGESDLKLDPALINEMLRHIRWDVVTKDASIKLACTVELLTSEKRVAFSREGVRSAEHNLKVVLNLARGAYVSLHRDAPIAREVAQVFPTGQSLAQALDNLAEPMYLRSKVPQGPEVISCYIRVQSALDEKTTSYFNEFETEMKARNANIKGSSLTLVDSEDPHTLTIVRSDDLLPSTDFEMWDSCRTAYIQQVTDPHRGIPAAELYIFPEEINACYYESRIPSVLAEPYRVLDPSVVALLEERQRLELFFHAAALGFVRMDASEGRLRWIYQLPHPKRPVHLDLSPSSIQSSFERPVDIFQVIYNFLSGESIDWNELSQVVVNEQQRLGRSRVHQLYRQALEGEGGIVPYIRSVISISRSGTRDDVLSQSIGKEYTDLMDVARIIYLEALSSLEQLPDSRDIVGFARRAGFQVYDTGIPDVFEFIPESENWSTRFTRPVMAFQLLDLRVDEKTIETALLRFRQLQKSGRDLEDVIFIAVDQPLSDETVRAMQRLRAEEGIQFITLNEQVLFDEPGNTLISLQEHVREVLGPQRDLYDRRDPVSDRLNFFGREMVVRDLLSRLSNGEPIGLFGLRKIGKSSLLRHLRSVANFPMAHVDLQAGADALGVFERALKHWYDVARNLRIIWEPDLDLAQDPIGKFRRQVERLRESSLRAGRSVPVLLVDEIERVFPPAEDPEKVADEIEHGVSAAKDPKKAPKYNPEKVSNYVRFADVLRGLVQEGQLGIICVGVNAPINRINRFGSEQNPFYQFLQEQYLGPLTDKDCKEMVSVIGGQMKLSYSENALESVVNASGGHPFLARQLCSVAYEALGSGPSQLTPEHIKTAKRGFISRPTTSALLNEEGLWGEVTNRSLWGSEVVADIKNILLFLAIHDSIEENGLPPSVQREVRERTLYEFSRRGLLRVNEGYYSIRFGVFRAWLRRYQLGGLDE